MEVGISNDKIVGVDHAFPVRIKMGGKAYLFGFGTDTGFHSYFRRRGCIKAAGMAKE